MARYREAKRYREARLLGIETGKPEYKPPELELKGFKIKFYDLADNKLYELGSDVKRGRISEASFELMDFGCGSFSFLLDDKPPFDLTYRIRVDIHLYFDETAWYTGFIQAIPQPGQKTPYEFSGFGFFEQLDWVTVSASYQNKDVADIVKDIIENKVAPNTQIIYNASKIERTGYTVNSIDFYLNFAKDAIQSLADIAQGYEFGVDNVREFYFRAIDTDLKYHYWAGKQFQHVKIEENPFAVRNRLYIKVGLIQGEGYGYIKEGSNCIGYVQDAASIGAYGLREDVVTAPDVLDIDDAERWAGMILQERKTPRIKAKISNVLFDKIKTKIDSEGKVRVTTHEGSEYELKIEKVSYSISSQGCLGEMELIS